MHNSINLCISWFHRIDLFLNSVKMDPPPFKYRGRMGFPLVRPEVASSEEKVPEPPATLGSIIGLKPGTRIPGLLNLLKGNCPISEIIDAAKSWAAGPVGEALMKPTEEAAAAPAEDPQVDLPPPPIDPTVGDDGVVDGSEELSITLPPEVPEGKVSHLHSYEGVWDTVDLNHRASQTGEGPVDTLRQHERWYDKFMIRCRVSAGGFPRGKLKRRHISAVGNDLGVLSCGPHIGEFTPDVRVMISSRYRCVTGYAIGKTLVSEGSERSNVLAAAAFAQELGFPVCDVDDVVNAWAPFGYLEIIPFNNLRWASKGGVDRLLMEALVMVRVTLGKAAPMVFGNMGTCVDAMVSRHPGAGACAISGTAMMGKSYDPLKVTRVAQPPSDDLVPTIIVPEDLIEEAVLDVDTTQGEMTILADGGSWSVEGEILLPVGRYRVAHSGLPDSEGRVRLCITEWLSSTWLSSSARLTYLAARDPRWCSMVRPAWMHPADAYITAGRTLWYAACQRPNPHLVAEWRGLLFDPPPAQLRSDGVYGKRDDIRACAYNTVFGLFGGRGVLCAGHSGRTRDQWLGHAYRQWLLIRGGVVRIDDVVATLIHGNVTQWNPRSAVTYNGNGNHLSVVGGLVTSEPVSEYTCHYGGRCELAPESQPCYCKRRSDLGQLCLPRLDAAGKYRGALPLAGHGELYDVYGVPYHAGSHGVRPCYIGAGAGNKWRHAALLLPVYMRRTDISIQDKSHLDCLVYNERRKRKLYLHESPSDETPDPVEAQETLVLEVGKRPKIEFPPPVPDLVDDNDIANVQSE